MRSIILLLSLMVFPLQAQKLSFVEKQSLEAEIFAGVDSYKNIYFVKDMALYKEGPLGNFVFKDFQLGPIRSVDIINPLNVLVFYEELNTLVFLDNRLNEIERINFNTVDRFINVGWAANAGNNRIWTFNVDSRQLELYNYRSGLQTVVSQPISGDVIDMASDFNYCYLLTNQSLYAFNVYGSALWKEAAEGITSIVQQHKNLIVQRDNELNLRRDSGMKPLKTEPSELSIKELQLTQEFLYIYDGNFLYTYTLTQPK